MSKNTYRLINPYVEGSIDTITRSSNAFGAGKKLYNTISNYFTNHVEDFYMTIQNLETKNLTHFKINEKRSKGNNVDFNLSKIEGQFPSDINNKLISSVDKLEKQSGGKKHKHHKDKSTTSVSSSSSSSSSSSDDYYLKIPLLPISRFTYFYLPYYKLNVGGLNPIDISRIYMPMFSLPINPTLEVRFDIYKYF